MSNMKSVIKKIIIFLLMLSLVTAVFSACNKVDNNKGYVVITFVTNCDIIIDPIILDGNEVDMPDDPLRAGYNFGGWFYDQLFTVAFKASNGFTTDTTLYAKWEKKSVTVEEGKIPSDQKDTEGFSYKLLDNDSYEVIAYSGFATTITIPDSFKNKIVGRIGEGAFKDNKKLKEIKFGYEISSIGKEAFRNCISLERITPKVGNTHFLGDNGVLYNDERSTIIAFCSKSGRNTFIIGKNVLKINEYAFSRVTAEITFEDKAKYSAIESFAFAEFEGKITLGSNIVEIRKDSFNNASAEVVFGQDCTLEEITNGAFASYIGEKLTIPNSVISLSLQPFNNCTATIDLTRSSLNALGNQAFGSYKGESLIIPLSVSFLDTNCFYQCSSIVTFQSGSLLRVVGEQAFNSFLGEVRFASGITEIQKYAFYCASINSKITFADKRKDIIVDEEAFKGNKGTVIFL